MTEKEKLLSREKKSLVLKTIALTLFAAIFVLVIIALMFNIKGDLIYEHYLGAASILAFPTILLYFAGGVVKPHGSKDLQPEERKSLISKTIASVLFGISIVLFIVAVVAEIKGNLSLSENCIGIMGSLWIVAFCIYLTHNLPNFLKL